MGKLQKQGNTGKKILKKLRNGTWVAVAVMGLIAIPAGTVNAQETSGTDVSGEMAIQTDVELQWVANTVEQVQEEISGQSDAKDQTPLEQYDIIWGDTLSVIAQATDTTVDELVALNNIENPDLIYAGDVLLLADGTLATVVEQSEEDATNNQENVAKEEVKEETKAEAPKVEEKQDTVAVEAPKEDTAKPTPTTNKETVKEEAPKGNENTPKEDVETPDETTKPEAPKEEVKNPGGVVETPNNGGGGNGNVPDTEEPTTPETPEVPKEEETPAEPTEPPIEEETPQEPVEPQPEQPTTPEVPNEEVIPVEPTEPPIENETPPVVIQPGTPGTPEVPPVPEVPETPETPGTPEVPGQPEVPATPEITESTRTVTEQVGFNIIRRANPNLPVGEELVIQEGSFGTKETVYKLTYQDGELLTEELVSEGVTLAPVDKIVEFGTMEEPEPEITESTRTVTEQLGYKEIRRANPDLPVGEERVVQEGTFGVKETVFKLTFEDGKLISEEKVSETVTTKAQDRIVEYGTKEEEVPELNRVDKVLNATDAEAYALANNMSLEETEEYLNMSQAEMEKLAGAIDYAKLNAEFGALMNQHRASLGLEALDQAEHLASGTHQIAKELADYGYIAPAGHPGHTRPNGLPTNSVFTEDEIALGRGENTAYNYNYNNPYQIVSEKFLAELFFQQWMDSPGHKANMEVEYYTSFTLAVQPVVNGQSKYGHKDANGNYVIEGNVGSYAGVGLVGVLSLSVEMPTE